MRDTDENGLELRVFIITYNNGNFHSSTTDQSVAWERARRIGGIIAELTNVHRPKYLDEIMTPELTSQITEFMHDQNRGVRRSRPTADIDGDRSDVEASTPPLDQSDAA